MPNPMIQADTFSDVLQAWPVLRVRELLDRCNTPELAVAALNRPADTMREADLAALLSPAAATQLEAMARKSQALTRQRFGKVIQFYAPLYVSNVCINSCLYCGFNCRNTIPRSVLSVDEAVREAEYLANEGFQHLLLVSGEDPKGCPVSYFEELAARLHHRFASLSVEIYPLSTADYARLVTAGVDSLTLYQETYDPEAYKIFHPAGPKRDFTARVNAMDRGAQAGLAFLGVGALLGLADWRVDAFYVGLHARYLQRRYWRQHLSVSFPRLRQAAGGFQPIDPVNDAGLAQIMFAMRLFLPDAGLVLSTRESAVLRDNLLSLGVTRVSAGSRTNPGGYAHAEKDAEGQFEVQDARSLAEVMTAVRKAGLDPICKDWDPTYHAA